jgi:hypothetical protein
MPHFSIDVPTIGLRVAIACWFPFDAEARLVLRDSAAMFLPGESSVAADRAVRDRIEAVADGAAELADALEQGEAAMRA